MGTITEGRVVSLTARVANRTDRPVHIGSVVTSCGCTTATMPTEVPANGSTLLHVRFNSRGFEGNVTKAVQVNPADGSQPAVLTLHLNCRPALRCSPDQIDLGSIPPGGWGQSSFLVQRVDGAPLLPFAVSTPRGVHATCGPITPGGCVVGVTERSSHPAADETQKSSITISEPGLPASDVSLRAVIRGPYTVTPPVISVGTIGAGNRGTFRAVLRGPNLGGLRVAEGPAGAKWLLRIVGNSAVLDVRFRAPNAPGSIIRSRFVLAVAGAGSREIVVPVFGAVSPQIGG